MCSTCADTGWVRVSREGIDGVIRCECIRGSRAERLLANAKIPQRYEHCELENFDIMPSPEKTIEKAKILAEKFVAEYPMSTPFGLLFMGPQGVGKTHLAVGIVKELMRLKSVSCLFRTFPELLKEIARGYDRLGDVQGNPYFANLGDLPGALISYQKADKIRRTVLDHSPAFLAERLRGEWRIADRRLR